jgi:hypothetical protein
MKTKGRVILQTGPVGLQWSQRAMKLVLAFGLPALLSAQPWLASSSDAAYAEARALYIDLHGHPELAFEEMQTAAKLSAQLKSLGFEGANRDRRIFLGRSAMERQPAEDVCVLP